MGRLACACALALVSACGGMNIVNPATGKCLDLFCPCEDGSDEKGCTRVKPDDLKKGANLQLYKCHNKENQQFEVLDNGRIRNPLTGLCIDMQAPCVEGQKGDKCDRVKVSEIKKEANVQLWTCHNDTGKLSSSYGNQKWTWKSNGLVFNTGAKLCLDVFAHEKDDGKRADAKELGDEANVQVYSCHSEGNQIFDLETGDLARDTPEPEAKFQVLPDGAFLKGSRSQSPALTLLAAAGVCGFLVASAALSLRVLRARAPHEMAPSE